MRKRREIETASLSFLDVISCGFGSLILLLVLTKVFEPVVLEDAVENLEGYLVELEQQLFELRGESRAINRKMIRREDQQVETLAQLRRLEAELTGLRAEHAKTLDETQVSTKIEEQLARAKQVLTEEMRRLLADYQRKEDDSTIGGIPVDSEYVIFIIDTSGSMFGSAWPLVMRKVEETLDVYPRLKGIQVMNDMGHYMFTQYANAWIPDTASRRDIILERLSTWSAFSNSSPVEGITKAISTFYRPGRKISLYVFGDEFSGKSIQRVLDKVDKINRPNNKGERLVRIHAIGFPVQFGMMNRGPFNADKGPSNADKEPSNTGKKFSILMRSLCERNGGTFVGLSDFREY